MVKWTDQVPQFATKERTGYSPRGLMGDSLSMLDRSVGRLMNLTAELDIDSSTLVRLQSTAIISCPPALIAANVASACAN